MSFNRATALGGIRLLAVVMFLTIGFESAEASPADCSWSVHNLILRIFDCEEQVCGRIVWLKEAKRPYRNAAEYIWDFGADRSE